MRAASASPSALTTFSCRSCFAFSTMNWARWASCWAALHRVAKSPAKLYLCTWFTNLLCFNSSSVLAPKTKLSLEPSYNEHNHWEQTLTIETSSKMMKKSLALSTSWFFTNKLTCNMSKWQEPTMSHLHHLSTLSNELWSIKLCHYCFQDFIADWRQYSLIIIQTKFPIHGWQFLLVRSEQHTETNINHLEVLAATGRGEELGTSANVIDNGVVQPRYPNYNNSEHIHNG